MRGILLCSLLLLLASPAYAEEERAAGGEKKVYVVNDYRYDEAGSGGDPDKGHNLCASCCNALSFDYLDYIMAGSWEIVRIAADREISVPLNNPFMGGNCICTVDEYQVRANNRHRPKPAQIK